MSTRVATKGRVPEYFVTSARKVEPLGGDCIRIYYSMERNGIWEDQLTMIMPIPAGLTSAEFITRSATEIFNETHIVPMAANKH